MTNEEKKVLIEEAQKWADEFWALPESESYDVVKAVYGSRYYAVNRLFHKLTGNMLRLYNGRVVEEVVNE